MRSLILFLALTIAPAAVGAQPTEAVSTEKGLERLLGLNDRQAEGPSNLGECQKACEEDESCRSFTYIKPKKADGKGQCWVRDTVTPGWSASCCVSGVRTDAIPAQAQIFEDIAMGPSSEDGTTAQGASKTVGLDLCLENGLVCGWPTAHAYCKDQGLGAALDYTVKRQAPPTLPLDGGGRCTGVFCHRIKSITCAPGEEDDDTDQSGTDGG